MRVNPGAERVLGATRDIDIVLSSFRPLVAHWYTVDWPSDHDRHSGDG